jgi:hypothetical protein
MNVERAIAYENYNPQTKDNDIALLTLPSPIPKGKNAKPIKISGEKDPKPGSTVTTSGWGDTFVPFGTLSRYLKIAKLKVVQRSICKDIRALESPITDNMICAQDATNSAYLASITQ